MRWSAPRPASGTGRTSYLAFGNSCAARYLAMGSYFDRQSWVLFGWRVNPAVMCSLAWTYGLSYFIWASIVLVATSSLPIISLSWSSAISFASRSMLDLAIWDLARPL